MGFMGPSQHCSGPRVHGIKHPISTHLPFIGAPPGLFVFSGLPPGRSVVSFPASVGAARRGFWVFPRVSRAKPTHRPGRCCRGLLVLSQVFGRAMRLRQWLPEGLASASRRSGPLARSTIGPGFSDTAPDQAIRS
jgi:hypothetical protein